MSNWRIPLSDLDYGDEERAAVLRVVDSKWLSMGPEVAKFESEFADCLGVKHAIGVASATAGLHLPYVALGLGPGDEVIQPALNFVAAANMTIATGAKPVFADVLSVSEPTIDPASVERLVTPRTRAVVAMHYGGQLCRMSELRDLCTRLELPLIEDACHAVGARYRHSRCPELDNRMAGTMGDVGAFSFFSNKNLATGEGGMVVTNRDDLAEKLRCLRSHGMTSLTWDRHRGHASSYDVVANGFNYRIDEIHAALGRAQLAKLATNNERRRGLLAQYHQALASLDGWTIPFFHSDGDTSGHLMVVVAPSDEDRLRVAEAFRESKVQTSLHYPSVAGFSAFAGCHADTLTQTDQFSTRAISLPMFPTMTKEQVHEVCSILLATA